MDLRYIEGITWLTPNMCSTGGSPPFNPDSSNSTNTNEPYLDCSFFQLEELHILSSLHLHLWQGSILF